MALANKTELKTFLSISIVDSDSAIAIVQKLFGVLGLKLTYLGRLGPRGQRERVYTYEPPNDGRSEIFTSWLQRDSASIQTKLVNNYDCNFQIHSSTSVSTIGKDNKSSQGMDVMEQRQEDSIKPGVIVRWLKTKGTWVVEATTGIIVKIRDTCGREAIVNFQELELCRNQ